MIFEHETIRNNSLVIVCTWSKRQATELKGETALIEVCVRSSVYLYVSKRLKV